MTAVYRWELSKLLAQKRTYLGLGAAMLVPLIFVVVLQFQSGGPNDVPLGRYIRDTGLAVPFVALFFMSFWAFPLITSLVAGDVKSNVLPVAFRPPTMTDFVTQPVGKLATSITYGPGTISPETNRPLCSG